MAAIEQSGSTPLAANKTHPHAIILHTLSVHSTLRPVLGHGVGIRLVAHVGHLLWLRHEHGVHSANSKGCSTHEPADKSHVQSMLDPGASLGSDSREALVRGFAPAPVRPIGLLGRALVPDRTSRRMAAALGAVGRVVGALETARGRDLDSAG